MFHHFRDFGRSEYLVMASFNYLEFILFDNLSSLAITLMAKTVSQPGNITLKFDICNRYMSLLPSNCNLLAGINKVFLSHLLPHWA